MLATAPPSSIFLSLCPMADQVHQFKGVRYVPIKAIRDSDRKWLSAGWLSKQMALNNYRPPLRHQTLESPRREVVRSSAGAGVVYPPFLGSFV